MNKLSTLILSILFLLFSLTLSSQTWTNNLPPGKIDSGEELTFYEIQNAFNDYWEPLNVKGGYYIDNGIRTKASGWKQFRRWEWYWENRVDPITGEFPNTSAAEIRQQIKKFSGVRNAVGHWLSAGPSTSSGGYAGLGRLNCVAFLDTDPSTFFVGSPSGGLWKTDDSGTSWTVLTDENDVLGVSDVIVYPSILPGAETIYIGTGDRDGGSLHSLSGDQVHDNNSVGVLKSVDGGTTWSPTDLIWMPDDRKTVNRILKHPAYDDSIYVAATDGVFLTTDGGAFWPKITGTFEFIDMEFKPLDPGVLYGSTKDGKVYRSGDKGITWVKKLEIPSGLRTELAVSPDEPGWIYALIAKPGGGLEGIYKSEDIGDSWALVFDGFIPGNHLLGYYCDGSVDGGQGSYDLCIAADPSDASIVFIGGVNTWKSMDGGLTWSVSNMWAPDPTYNFCGAPVVHADKHALAFHPGTGALFECNDGGLYITDDLGSSWDHLGSGLIISQLYRLGVSQLTPNNVIAGLQDNGTKSLLSGTWTDVIGGDGMECLIDYTDDDTQYGELYFGGMYRTTDGWSTSTPISGGLSGSAAWVTPFAIDPITPTTLYVGRDTVWKSLDQGTSWSKISSFSTGGTIRSLAVAPSDPDTIYIATKSKIWATFDGGLSWAEKTGSLPVASSNITYISVNSDFADTLWVAMGEYNFLGVYQSTDAGATWTDISAGLPMIPVMCVIQNRQNDSEIELYAATDVGVYVKVGAAPWVLFSEGLPNVVVTELEIYYDDIAPNLSRLRAATFGRGLWESELYYPPGSTPIAGFIADNTMPNVDSVVIFTDLTVNDPVSWSWTFTPSTVTFVNSTSSTSQNPQVTFDAAGAYEVELTATSAFGSDTETKAAYVTVVAPHIWLGGSSTSWTTAANWDLGTVPDETNQVVIESGASFYPELTSGGTVNVGPSGGGSYNCKSLTIESGGTVTVGSTGVDKDLLIYGDVTVKTGGSLLVSDDIDVKSGGRLFIHGGTVENIFDTGGFGDFILNPGSGGLMSSGSLTVFSDIVLHSGSTWNATGGTLHCGGAGSPVIFWSWNHSFFVQDVVIDPDVDATIDPTSFSILVVKGNFTQSPASNFLIPLGDAVAIGSDYLLESDATGTASLINDGGLTVAGSTVVERFMIDDSWHLISSPVGSETASSLYFSGTPVVWLKEYLEPSNTWGFITSLSTPLTQGTGLSYWIDEATFRSDVTVSFEGPLLSTDLTVSSFAYSGDAAHGYNIAGNPFPCAIDWDIGSWDTTDINGSVWVWEDGGSGDGSGTYLYRNSVGLGSLTDGIIPMAQGFFIQTTSLGASLTIPSDARVFSTSDFYKSEDADAENQYVVLEVNHLNKKDEAWIAFSSEATTGFDKGWDVNKLFSEGNYPQLYLEENNLKLSIDAIPLLQEEARAVALNFRTGNSGAHLLTVKDFQNMQETEIILEDLFEGTFHNMHHDGAYAFNSLEGDAHERFLLHFNPQVAGLENPNQSIVNIYGFNKTIYINYPDFSNQAQVHIYDMYGREIRSQNLSTSQLNTINLDLNYTNIIVKTVDNGSVTVKKIFIP